jgi:hypothetical protein
MNTRASADRYARALLDVVAKEGNPEQVQQELAGLAGVFSNPELSAVLKSPAVPLASKRGIVETLIARTKPSGRWEATAAAGRSQPTVTGAGDSQGIRRTPDGASAGGAG